MKTGRQKTEHFMQVVLLTRYIALHRSTTILNSCWTKSFKPCMNFTSCHASIAARTDALALPLLHLLSCSCSVQSGEGFTVSAPRLFLPHLSADGLPVQRGRVCGSIARFNLHFLLQRFFTFKLHLGKFRPWQKMADVGAPVCPLLADRSPAPSQRCLFDWCWMTLKRG